MNTITCIRRHIIPCTNMAPNYCQHRLLREDQFDTGIKIWCICWRENNDKTKIINACDRDFYVGKTERQ